MKLKIDENLPIEVCDALRAAGHDVLTVADEKLAGSPDSDIALVCRSEDRALITLDTDFGNILAYPPEQFPGIIVIRADDQSKPAILTLFSAIVRALRSEPISHHLWIVEHNRIRVRGSE